MSREEKAFFVIIFISMIIITVIAGGIISKKRKVLTIVGVLIITVEIVAVLCPCVLDFYNASKGEYEMISGVALSNGRSTKVPWKTVKILDDRTGDKITLMFFSERINKGDQLTVRYLKHIKFGTLMEKKNGENDKESIENG